MRERTWKARRDKLLAEEAVEPETWWWLSFADDTGFRGGVMTRARGVVSAIQKTHRLGINPGGEVASTQLPDEAIQDAPFNPADFADQLLSKTDIDEKLGGARKMPNGEEPDAEG